jgi:tRNA U54 and U55 pseudouridine synthase Pus10
MTGRAEISRLRAVLDATFERGKALAVHADIETQADSARYLCVLVSGYLGRSVAELLLAGCVKRLHRLKPVLPRLL